MKKFIAILMSVVIVFSLAACGASPGAGNQNDSPPPEISSDDVIVGEITVSAFDSIFAQSFLEEAAARFEDMHPGTTIHIETFSAMPEVRRATGSGGGEVMVSMLEDDPQARTDYINRISAQLMSGGGPDILAMDVLPIYQFVRSGMLKDLSAYMDADPDFDRADFRTNIFDATQVDGRLWFVPLDYSFEFYNFDSTLVPAGQASAFGPGSAVSTQQLLDIGSPLHGGSEMLFDQPEFVAFGGPGGRRGGMFRTLLREDFSSFVNLENRTAHFDDGRFAALLTSLREQAERGYFPAAIGGEMPDINEMMRIRQEQPNERVFYKGNSSSMLMMDFARGLTEGGLMMFGSAMGTITDDDMIAGIAANTDGSVPFTFTQGYAINSNSQNPRLAWEFIKFLLSHEMQTSPGMFGVSRPVRLSATQPRAEMFFSNITHGRFGMEQTEPLTGEARQAMYAYLETAELMVAQINSFNFRDAVIDDIINAEVALFFDGSKTANEVAASLQSRVQLILSE
ncbi:MAG: extracellular solute-binding protein [Oscillospiraceae bacterium]|nr:extracellular solute-binding protein [Oscillospiraceae bacterium]